MGGGPAQRDRLAATLRSLATRDPTSPQAVSAILDLTDADFGERLVVIGPAVWAQRITRLYANSLDRLAWAACEHILRGAFELHPLSPHATTYEALLECVCESEAPSVRKQVTAMFEARVANAVPDLLPVRKTLAALARALPATVRIESGGEHVGSGVLVSSNLILTAAHVVQAMERGDSAVIFTAESGEDEPPEPVVATTSPALMSFSPPPRERMTHPNANELDVALVAIRPQERDYVAESHWGDPDQSSDVCVVQHPETHRRMQFSYWPQGIHRIEPSDDPRWITYRNTTFRGASGSPVFDGRSHLIGIHTCTIGGVLNRATAVRSFRADLARAVSSYSGPS